MDQLQSQWPCRRPQIHQLSALLGADIPTLVVHGPKATGKSGVTRSLLETIPYKWTTVNCRESITGRHLLEHIVAAVHASLDCEMPARCESISALAVHLETMLENESRFILMLDGIDRQREALATLTPAVALLSHTIPSLTVVLIARHPSPRLCNLPGIPHVYFPPYTRQQSMQIMSQHPPDIFLTRESDDDDDDATQEEDKAWLWARFCAAVWDSLGQHAARDLESLRELCDRLWRPFVEPITKGEFGPRDFSRLLVAQRRLFQDESALQDVIVSGMESDSLELPHYTKWLLIAAYLASYNPAKMDQVYYMRTTERKQRKAGARGGRRGRGGARGSIRPLLSTTSFTLDRLLSVLHAILPHDDLRTTVDVYTQIATLTRLRLLVKGGVGGEGLDGKWKVGSAVSWEYVLGLARNLDFGIVDYVQ
ncbi:hypothetical protein K470DRAFT_221211 [Piedraia hortae CBS 480.64]|uniref:Uncharacterized protein n=1 Tax=Piedraia hortae CBS 480.64 TaxID=1314780 RepID=A0A6A7BTD4_9PEZI|nr:hypothetical protein K470DRAFT_221211 [Piedraia hortae CBS 480.64]